MMKKNFDLPSIEIVMLDTEDVITTSAGDENPRGKNETPDW